MRLRFSCVTPSVIANTGNGTERHRARQYRRRAPAPLDVRDGDRIGSRDRASAAPAAATGGRHCSAAAHPRGRAARRLGALASAGGHVAPAHVEHAHVGPIRALERSLPRARLARHRRRARPSRRRLRGPRAPSSSVDASRRRLGERRREEPHRALGGVEVARLGGEMAERDQRLRGDAVARRRRVVVPGLRAVEEPLVVVAREPEAAALAVLEARRAARRRARSASVQSSRRKRVCISSSSARAGTRGRRGRRSSATSSPWRVA